MTVKLQQPQQQEYEQEKQLQMIFICAKNCQINPMNGRAKLPVISGYLLACHAQTNGIEGEGAAGDTLIL